MIDVIVPAYNSQEFIDDCLTSISLQSIKDKIKVTIVNDGSLNDYKKSVDFFKKYIDVREIGYKNNKGPGHARKYGINHTKGKYIVFIDSDDSFYDKFSLEKLYNKISKNDLDYVNSAFYEEVNGYLYIKEEDNSWLHGKIYKREFLEDNNIDFNDTRCNEDNGFNALVLLSKPKKAYICEATYIWKANMSSITRRNNYEYQYTGLFGFIDNIVWALEMKKSDKTNLYNVSKMALETLYYLYLCYQAFYFKDNIDDLIKSSSKLYKFYKLYDFNKFEFIKIINEELERNKKYFDNTYFVDPILTFSSFLDMVGEYHD